MNFYYNIKIFQHQPYCVWCDYHMESSFYLVHGENMIGSLVQKDKITTQNNDNSIENIVDSCLVEILQFFTTIPSRFVINCCYIKVCFSFSLDVPSLFILLLRFLFLEGASFLPSPLLL